MNKIKVFTLLIISVVVVSCSSDDGKSSETNIPVIASFSQSVSGASINEVVIFTDTSSGNPTSWQWNFEGGTPSTSTEQNPTVFYDKSGNYDVKLVVSNGNSSDEILKEGVINVVFDLTEGLIAQFLLNGNGNDSSGNNIGHSIIGNVNATTNRDNENQMALEFDINEGRLEVGTATGFEIGEESAITVSAWINPFESQNGFGTIVRQINPDGSNGESRFGLSITTDGSILWASLDGFTTSTNPIAKDVWTHIVAVYNNRIVKLYINSVLDVERDLGPATISYGITGNGANMRIGESVNSIGGVFDNFIGKIDDINLYDRELSDEEIKALFED